MRPVVRGECPKDSDGSEIQYTSYKNARGELIRRLGEYCSYCEMQLDASLAVEHVQPKKPPGATSNIQDRELSWDNFLLACPNCNSTKSNVEVNLDDYFWPDRDNTFRALKYREAGLVTPADNLTPELREKASATIRLTGLDQQPMNDPAASDRRWENRREAWDLAERSKRELTQCNTTQMRNIIALLAVSKGYWSTWMTVFTDDGDMRKRFINAFKGTSQDCFNEHEGFASQERSGGRI
jgi:uncharacterized protein (TIGR02646 family)